MAKSIQELLETGNKLAELTNKLEQLNNAFNKSEHGMDFTSEINDVNEMIKLMEKLGMTVRKEMNVGGSQDLNSLNKSISDIEDSYNRLSKISISGGNSLVGNIVNSGEVDKSIDKLNELESKVSEYYNKVRLLNDENTRYSYTDGVPTEVGTFNKEVKALEELESKIKDVKAAGADTSSLKKLAEEFNTLSTDDNLNFKINEIASKDILKDNVEYAKELKRYLNDIIKSLSGEHIDESKDIGDYLSVDERSLKPYGIKTRQKTDEDLNLLDNESFIALKNTIFEIDEDKLNEVGEEYKLAVQEFMRFLLNFKELNKELSSTSALNEIAPKRFLNTSGEIRPEFKDVLGIVDSMSSLSARQYMGGVDASNVSYKLDDGTTIKRAIAQLSVDGDKSKSLYTKSNQERLDGFTDDKGYHLGYKELVKKLEGTITGIIESLSKLSNFTPGLVSDDVLMGVHKANIMSVGKAGYEGTDLAKRMSFGKLIESGADIASVDDVPITQTLSFKELGQAAETVAEKLKFLGKELPASSDAGDAGGNIERVNSLKGKKLGDMETVNKGIDGLAESYSKQVSENIEDWMSDSQKEASKIATDLKNNVYKQISKTGILGALIVDDTEERIKTQYDFKSNYSSSKSKAGSVDHWTQAKTEVEKIDAKQKYIEHQFAAVKEIFDKKEYTKLVEPASEFDSDTPIQLMNNLIQDMLEDVQTFDKGSFAESASKADKNGKILFDKDKYIKITENIYNVLNSLAEQEDFEKFGTDYEQLEKITNNAEQLKKQTQASRNDEVSKKLNFEYIKNTLAEKFVSDEITSREENLNSGLLAGSDLINAQKKLESLNSSVESIRNNIEQINSESSNNGIDLDASIKKADILKDLYSNIANELGSNEDADKFFKQVQSQSKITSEGLVNIADGFGDRLSSIDIGSLARDFRTVKNELNLVSGGGYERNLKSNIVSSKGLSKQEQEVARYTNEAIKEQLNNAKLALFGNRADLDGMQDNIKAEDLNEGINKINEVLNETSKKIDDAEIGDETGELAGKIIGFRGKLGKLQVEFDKVAQGLNDDSGIGQLRYVFESSKMLGVSLNTLQQQVDNEVRINDKNKELKSQRSYNEELTSKFNSAKSYVSDQETLTNKKMPLQDQIEYYKRVLPQFEQYSKEYITILSMQRQAEQNLVKESESATAKMNKIMKDRMKAITDSIKGISSFINNAANKIISIIRNGINIINKVIRGVIGIINTAKNTITRILTLLGGFGNRVRSAFGFGVSGSKEMNGGLNILKGTATELVSKIRLIQMGFNSAFNNKYIESAMELYQSVYSLGNIIGGNLTQDTIDWANKMEYAFGLSARRLIADLNELSGVLYGLGMKTQDVAVGSQNILMIGRYLAFMGGAGGKVDEVMNKLVSGMKGMTASIDDLGLSVREAQMDDYLKKLKKQGGEFANIGTSFAGLNEEARVYVRYASLIGQFSSKYNLSHFADALDTITGRISILKESIYSLGSVIGQVFVKILAGVAPTLIVVIKTIEDKIKGLATKLSTMFNIDIETDFWKNMNKGGKSIGGVGDSVADLNNKLDETADKAKKATNGIADFDLLSSSNKSSGDDGLGDEFDYSKLMATALDGLNEIADEASKSYLEKLNENLTENIGKLKQKLNDKIVEITGRVNFDIEFDLEKAKESVKEIWENIKKTFSNLGSIAIELVLKFADDINLGKIINDILDLIAAISRLVEAFTGVLGKALRYLYDTYLSEYFVELGISISDTIHKAIDWIDRLTERIKEADYKKIIDDIVATLTILFNIFNGKPVSPEEQLGIDEFREAHPVIAALADIFGILKDVLVTLYEGAIKPLLLAFKGLFEEEDVNKIKEVNPVVENLTDVFVTLKDILMLLYYDVIKPLLASFGEFAKNELLPWLVEKLKELKTWIGENSEKIKEFSKRIGEIAWEVFKKFVDLVGELIKYVVENPDNVANFFKILIGLKVASWVGGLIKPITDLLGVLKKLKNFFAGETVAKGFESLGKVASKAGGKIKTAGTIISGFVKGSGVLTGTGASTASGVIMSTAMGAVGVGMGVYDGYKLAGRSDEVFGEEEGGTLSAKVSSFAGGYLGGNHGGIMDEADSAGEKAKNVGMNALKGAALGGAIGSVIPGIGTAIGAAVGGVVGTITGAIGGENISKAINGAWELAKSAVISSMDAIKEKTDEVMEKASSRFSDLKDNTSEMLENTKTTITESFNSIKDNTSEAMNNIREKTRDSWENIKTSTGTVLENLTGNVNNFKENAVLAWESSKNKVVETFNDAKTHVSSSVEGMRQSVDGFKTNAIEYFNTTKEKINTSMNNAKELAVGAWSDAKTRFGTIADNIYGAFDGLKGKFSELWGNLKSTATTMLDGIKESVGSAWDNIKTGAGNISTSIKGYVTGETKVTKMPSITRRATGGTQSPGGLFIAGGPDGPELVGNITSASGTDVANNTMIIKAMQMAMSSGILDGMADILSQLSNNGINNGGDTIINIGEGGFNVVDESSVSKLASMIAPHSNKNKITRADSGFRLA